MRKLVVTEYITLDGVFDEPGHWSFDYWSDEAAKYKYDELFATDIQLLGRITYEGFAKAWPTMEGTGEFGERMNNMPKYVVSTTLNLPAGRQEKPLWNNTKIIKTNVAEEIRQLKKGKGGNVLVAGSGKLVRFLGKHKLVDEYRFLLHPVVMGKGKRLFTEGTDKLQFELVETKTLPKGLVALHYKPTSL